MDGGFPNAMTTTPRDTPSDMGWKPMPRGLRSLALHATLLAAAAVMLLPFAWLICASFKRGEDLFTYTFLPWDDLGRLTLDNYRALFADHPFGSWMLNSVFLASTHTVLVVTLSSMAGFALAKYRFRGRRLVMLAMLCTMLIPGVVLLPGSYELILRIGWIDSYLAILVPSAVSVFGSFLFRQAMLEGVRDELLEAARVDGCSELRLWWEVALPAVRPMTGAFTLMSFLAMWNSFLWPQVVLQDEGKYHLPIGLANLLNLPQYRSDYGLLMAGTVLSVLPVVVLFALLQREFIAGLTSGAVKG